MKKSILLIAIGACLCMCASAREAPPNNGNPETIGKSTILTDAFMYEMVYAYEDLTLNQVGTLAHPFVLCLRSPQAVTEPVKRTYRYTFIRYFDWRCQKK